MFTDPRQLTVRIIDDLESLSAFLEDEIDERTHHSPGLTLEAQRCKETLMTVRALLPRLRVLEAAESVPLALPRTPPVCINCD